MKRYALRTFGGAATWALVRAETTIWLRSADGWLAALLAAAVAALSCAWLGKLSVDLSRLYPFAVAASGALAAVVSAARTVSREGPLVELWLAAPLFGRELARAKALAAGIRSLPVLAAACAAACFELRPGPAGALALLFVGLAAVAICAPLALALDLRLRPLWSPLLLLPCAVPAAALGYTATLPLPLAAPATLALTVLLVYAALRRLGEHLASFEYHVTSR